MVDELKKAIADAVKSLFNVELQPELTRPDEQFGDYATNVALQLAGQLNKNPRQIAEQLLSELQKISGVASAETAGPGFINFKLTDEKLASAAASATDLPKPNAGKVIVLEHTDPNPFKEFHIGHAYSNTVGTSIGKLLKASGAKVHQVSYHGDVGLHIATAIYGMKKLDDAREGRPLSNIDDENWPEFVNLGKAYAEGSLEYKENPEAKTEIDGINAHVYKHDDSEINELYEEGRKRSLENFEGIYRKLNTKFEKNYFESETAVEGEKVVKENVGKVFEKSDGAIVYDGEKVGLHTRVFITSKGLPTYEAKEIGLAFAKQKDYPKAESFVVITANEIDEYFKVLVAAIKEIDPKLAAKIRHLSHGVVKFPEGKMSSRTGNVKLLVALESDVEEKVKELYEGDKNSQAIVFGAIKYEFLKHRIGSDFIFDVDESISLQGNSGPYLQYAHARACSILAKAGEVKKVDITGLEPAERSLARKISEYPEVVALATEELMPHHVCTYLYELAQTFNRFYESNRVIGDPREELRLKLVEQYASVLKHGLNLLNIEAPEHM